MEFLKRMAGIGLFLVLTAQLGTAQSQQALIAAFAESYQIENSGDYAKASEALIKVFDKDSYEINLRLGWLSFKAGLLDKSESYYRRAVHLMPYGIEARFGLVFPLSSLGHWQQVIQIYQEILAIDPQNSTANYRFGLVYYGQEAYGKAENLFAKTVNLYPFDYDGLHMLAWTKLRLGKTQEAKALFNKALLYLPSDPSCLEGLGLIK